MRLPFSTLVLSATALFSLFLPPVLSIHPHALNRREHRRAPAPHILTSRQHHIARDILDVCINANVNLAANASQLLGLGSLLGDLGLNSTVQLCLCLKDLNVYLDTNDDVQALVGLLGKNTVSVVITALINTSPAAKKCTFPPHAHHTCNNSDPCHYDCDTNYVRNGDTCVCAPPNISCNGVCGSFPQGCSSSVPSKKRAEPVSTLAQAQARCKPHETVCGVPGQVGSLAFECIDVSATADSCGGCVVPHSFPVDSVQTLGKDCTSIPNAKSSTCSENRCIVNSCSEGWFPNTEKEECIPPTGSLSRMRRVRKRSEPLSANATANATVDSELVSQIAALVNLVIKLGDDASSAAGSAPSQSSDSGAPVDIASLVNPIITATTQLADSPTVASLISSTNSLLSACQATQRFISTSGLDTLEADLRQITLSVLGIQGWCRGHPVTVPGLPPTPTYPSSSNPLPVKSTAPISPPSVSAPAASTPSTSEAVTSDNTPIVIGLSKVLTGLKLLGPVNATVTVGGLGSSLSDTVNGLLNGFGIGPVGAKRRNVASSSNTAATVNSELRSQVEGLVDMVLSLEDAMSNLPPGDDLDTSSTSLNDHSILGVAHALGHLLQSSTVSALLTNIDAFNAAVSALEDRFTKCSCTTALGIDHAADLLNLVNEAGLGLKSWCATNPIVIATPADPSPSSLGPLLPTGGPMVAVSHTASTTTIHATPLTSGQYTSPSSLPGDIPIALGLDNFLPALGLDDSSGFATIDGLGDNTDTTVNNVLDGVAGIGPSGIHQRRSSATKSGGTKRQDLMREVEQPRKRQVTATANATIDLGLTGQIDALVDLVLGLNGAASALPPAPTASVTGKPTSPTTPSGFGPVAPFPSGLPSIPTGSIALPSVSFGVGPTYPDPSGVPTAPTGSFLPPSAPSGLDPASAGRPFEGSNPPAIDSCLVNGIIDASIALLSCRTYEDLVSKTEVLISETILALGALAACNCTHALGLGGVYDYLVQILDSALLLQDWYRRNPYPLLPPPGPPFGHGSPQSPASTAHTSTTAASAAAPTASTVSTGGTSGSSDDEPLVIGLTKLLNGLGINISADVVVDKLLGNDLDHTLNSVLNSLGIGPDGARKRSTVAYA